jgi:RHS repeat-associated protein
MFNARDRDPDTLLYNYRYRYYSPGLGRFVQPDPVIWLNQDPIGELGGLNLYGFVYNNPLRFIDPFGLIWYDDLAGWVQGKVQCSKNTLNNNLPWWLAGAANTVLDPGGGLASTPAAIGHLGEGSGNFSADPTLENSAGVFQDISVGAGVLAGGLGALPSMGGGAGAGSMVGRPAANLAEQLTMQEAQAGAGSIIMRGPFGDPKYQGCGWVKMQHIHKTPCGNTINVHYMKNLKTGATDKFKFK